MSVHDCTQPVVCLEHLPFDIWAYILCHLSVKSLCWLRLVSRSARDIVDARSVWFAVLVDLLAVQPLPYSHADLEAMTTEQLRAAATRIVQLDLAFSTQNITSRMILDIKNYNQLRMVSLLPGGTQYVGLLAQGELQLYDIDCPNPIARIACPLANPFTTFQMYPVSLGKSYLLQVLLTYRTPHYVPIQTEFRIIECAQRDFAMKHRVVLEDEGGVSVASVTLLHDKGMLYLTYVKRGVHPPPEDDFKTTVCVRAILPTADAATFYDLESVFQLRDCSSKWGTVAATLLSPRRLLVSNMHGHQIFDIPPNAITSGEEIHLTAFWKLPFRRSCNTIEHGPTMPLGLSHTCSPRVGILAWTNTGPYAISVSPDRDASREDVHCKALAEGKASFHLAASQIGASHALLNDHSDSPGKLLSALFGSGSSSSTTPDAGCIRLDRPTRVPGATQAALPLGSLAEGCVSENGGSMSRMTFDEVSGRLLRLDLFSAANPTAAHIRVFDMTQFTRSL